MIPQKHIGTDPGQGNVLALRTVNTASGGDYEHSLHVDQSVCTLGPDGDLITVDVEDNPLLSYPIALGSVVQLGINQWMEAQGYSAPQAAEVQGEKPNCLQAGQGYKARPLNGIWATPPFLHNGSVPSIAALLGPAEARPVRFLLGDPTFDTTNIGLKLHEADAGDSDYNRDGYFVLDTTTPGNSNRGHEFTDKRGPGRIGPALSTSEVEALIEFIKTL